MQLVIWPRPKAWLVIVLFALATACGGGAISDNSGLSPEQIASIRAIKVYANGTFVVGYTVQLSADADNSTGLHSGVSSLPVSHFDWKSSDPAAISVDGDGLATVHFDPGQDVTITASVGGKTGTLGAHIVKHLMIDPDTSYMFAGQVRSLMFYVNAVSPAKSFSGAWRSSNPGVASVDTIGVVTALAPGATTVSVAREGATYNAEITVRDVPPLRFTQLTYGNYGHCALATDGAAWCWGPSGGTVLALGTNAPVDRCLQIVNFVGPPTFALFQQYRESCAMEPVRAQVTEPLALLDQSGGATCGTAASGRVYCWGATPDLPGGTATTVQALSSNLIFARFSYPCGVTTTHEAWCYGKLSLRGTASATSVPEPSRVDGGAVFTDIAGDAGLSGSRCAITTSGAVLCWGANYGGQLATGDTVSSVVPKAINSTLQFGSVKVGNSQTCALSVGGGLYCWGAGRKTPTAISPELTFTSLSSGYKLCAVAASGVVYCANESDNAWALTSVGAPPPFKAYVGYCGIGVDGITYCMNGDNLHGELGVGDLLPRGVFTRVAGQ